MVGISVVIWISVSLLLKQVASISNRHEIYWNAYATPKLSVGNDEEYVLRVKIGEFLDILCPQRSLMGITNGPKEPPKFDLYNVTKKNYLKCHNGGNKKNFIFACNRPERENKLTIKFQTISPSPLGFRFQYCAEYYFVALPPRHKHPGCTKNSTRIRIIVQCKDEPKRKTSTTTTTTTTTTHKSTTIKSTTQVWRSPKEDKGQIVHPPMRNTQKNKTVSTGGVHGRQQDKQEDGRGSAGRLGPSRWWILALCCTLLFYPGFARPSELV